MIYLIPTVLAEGATRCLPNYLLPAIEACEVFFVENERTARRYIKSLKKDFAIDERDWYNMKELTPQIKTAFLTAMQGKKNIGILSEAGCPGVADPGQLLVALAQQQGVRVQPLVGPNSILLALMASGLNGQHFQFVGYLPIDQGERISVLKKLEAESRQKSCTQIFIETPYRNQQMIETVLKVCQPDTLFCIAANLTSPQEMVVTRPVHKWKNNQLQIHKQPAIFLLSAV